MEENKCQCGTCECEKDKKVKKENKKDKIKELENELLKVQADSINYRKRLEEETSKIIKFANEDLIKEILPIIDNFERAISMETDENSKFLSGFKMIYCSLLNVLKKYEVVEIDGNDKPFNPTYHEAILVEKAECESGMVLEVLQKGYLLKGKVIRPAMVKVSE